MDKKRPTPIKGASKASISTKFGNVIDWIRHDKNMSRIVKELYNTNE